LPSPARAAQGYDNCAGFIDALPTILSTQGAWCLRHGLTTNITSGPDPRMVPWQAKASARSDLAWQCNDRGRHRLQLHRFRRQPVLIPRMGLPLGILRPPA
jgi:hypothetical protein